MRQPDIPRARLRHRRRARSSRSSRTRRRRGVQLVTGAVVEATRAQCEQAVRGARRLRVRLLEFLELGPAHREVTGRDAVREGANDRHRQVARHAEQLLQQLPLAVRRDALAAGLAPVLFDRVRRVDVAVLELPEQRRDQLVERHRRLGRLGGRHRDDLRDRQFHPVTFGFRRALDRIPQPVLIFVHGTFLRAASISIRSIFVRIPSTCARRRRRSRPRHARRSAAARSSSRAATTVETLRSITSAHDRVLVDAAGHQLMQQVALGEDAGELALVEHGHLRDAVLLEQVGRAATLSLRSSEITLAAADRAQDVADRADLPVAP